MLSFGRHYLDLLTSALVIRQLQPWHTNIGKRQVKAPKVSIIDSGILRGLLNLPRQTDVEGHPMVRGGRKRGFEIKRTSSPQVTPSMRSALEDLHLVQLDVIHAGDRTFDLAPRIRAVGLSRLLEDVRPLQPPTPNQRGCPMPLPRPRSKGPAARSRT